jgi:hypothetical protein
VNDTRTSVGGPYVSWEEVVPDMDARPMHELIGQAIVMEIDQTDPTRAQAWITLGNVQGPAWILLEDEHDPGDRIYFSRLTWFAEELSVPA